MRFYQTLRPFFLIVAVTLAGNFTSAKAGENGPILQELSGCVELTGLEDGRGAQYLAFWNLPDTNEFDGSVLTGMAQRFVSLQPETLRMVTFQHRVVADFMGDLAMYDNSSTNGVRIAIRPDDGTGNIDNNASPLAVEFIPGGLANLYPASGNRQGPTQFEMIPVDFSAHNLVLAGTWHISVEMTSANPDDGTLFFPISHPDLNEGIRGSVNYRQTVQNWKNGADSELWRVNGIALPFDFLVRPLLCSGGSCCIGSAGNVDGDPMDISDIADLTFLIDHLFINFPTLVCPAEGNIDGDVNGVVDIADLTLFIDHLFINFPPTAACR